MNPASSTSRSYTRLAVCRCLRGMRRSAASHESTRDEYPSIPERPEERALGAGEQSSITAYLRTVSLDTFSRLAISRHETPLASRILIRCCIDTGIVIPFLSRGPSGRSVSTRENSRTLTDRCRFRHYLGEMD